MRAHLKDYKMGALGGTLFLPLPCAYASKGETDQPLEGDG